MIRPSEQEQRKTHRVVVVCVCVCMGEGGLLGFYVSGCNKYKLVITRL